jgi:uncharacterized protein (DUF1800 family)
MMTGQKTFLGRSGPFDGDAILTFFGSIASGGAYYRAVRAFISDTPDATEVQRLVASSDSK